MVFLTIGRPAVDGGERAVMYDRLRGVVDKPIGEGTHFRVPWLQNPYVMDIRTRPRSIASVTGTKGMGGFAWQWCTTYDLNVGAHADLQMVNITLRVLSKPDVERLPLIFQV